MLELGVFLMDKFIWLAITGIGIGAGLLATQRGKKKLASSKLGKSNDLKSLKGNDGFIISRHMQLSFEKSCEGVAVIAPPGEHKTTAEFYTNLLSNNFPTSSIIVYDKKGELWRDTRNYQEKVCGRKAICYRPLGKEARCNLLELCKGFTEVRELATDIIHNAELAMKLKGRSLGSAEWPNMAVSLLTAILLYCKTLPKPKNTITEAYRMLLLNDNLQLENIITGCKSTEVKEQFLIYKSCLDNGDLSKSNGTARSIKVTLLTSMALFSDPKLSYSISATDFTPEKLRQKPIALYIQYEEDEYLSPYMSVFYSFFIKRILYYKGQTKLPVIFMLDEFQNLGQLTGIQTVLAECRASKMAFMICLQNLVRLYQIYGKENALTIWNCLKTKCVLPSLTDIEVLNLVSIYAGYTEIETATQTENNKQSSKTKSKTKVKLFEPDEIRRLPDEHTLIIAHNKLPLLDKLEIYYKYDKYKNNIF